MEIQMWIETCSVERVHRSCKVLRDMMMTKYLTDYRTILALDQGIIIGSAWPRFGEFDEQLFE